MKVLCLITYLTMFDNENVPFSYKCTKFLGIINVCLGCLPMIGHGHGFVRQISFDRGVFDEGYFFACFQNNLSTFVPQTIWTWVWDVKTKTKVNIKCPYLYLVMGFYVHFHKFDMFSNKVHTSCTWEDMCSQGNKIKGWGEGGISHSFQNQMRFCKQLERC